MSRKPKIVGPSVQDAIEEVTAEKGIDSTSIQAAIEEAISEAFRHQFQTNMDVRTNLKPNGSFTIEAAKTVVETVNDPLTEIAQSDQRAARHGLGDNVFVEVTSSSVSDNDKIKDQLGRMAALVAKQVIRQKLRDAERRRIYEEYKGREGELIHGKVQRLRHGSIIVDLGRTEAILPRRETIPRERYTENDRIKAVIVEVRLDQKGPQIVLSRAHPWMVHRLFEMEITEVYDKTVEIKAVAREAGFRTKVAVTSRDQQVDPVGACVGQKGIRVQTVVKELGGEKIDIVYWDPEPTTFIRNALLPAECDRVILDETRKVADVIVSEEFLSLAIGKDGQNARLASKLTDWSINIRGAHELSREKVKEFMQLTFGTTPAEILAGIGIGAETAPILEAAGFTGLDKIVTAKPEELAASVGEEVAARISATARKVWADLQAQASALMQDKTETPAEAAKRKETGPFTLPNGVEVKDLAELMAAMDELPGDAVNELLQKDELKLWMQDVSKGPEEIASLMERYR